MDALSLTLALLCVAPPSSPPERVTLAAVEGPEAPREDESAAGEVDASSEAVGNSSDEPGEPSENKKKKKKKVDTQLRARVIAGARLKREAAPVDAQGDPVGSVGVDKRGSLDLRQARMRFAVSYRDILSARVSAEFADLLGSPGAGKVIRDAWANIEIHSAFRIKVGNFKRAYSRLELRGVSQVPIIGRGLFNSYAIEDLSWGDRAVGVGLWGKIKPKRPGLHRLSWAVNASNNAVAGAPAGVDTHARLTYDPIAWLSIGAGGAFKYVEDTLADEDACRTKWIRDPGCRRSVYGASVDLTFQTAGLYASVEANLAQDWLFADESPFVFGALAYASYDFEVGERTVLQPVLFGEYVDANMSYGLSEATRLAAGFNVLWTKHLRVLPQVEWIKPLSTVTAFNPFTERWVVGLWVQVQI